MGQTTLRKADVEAKLTDKESKFIYEYCIDFNGTRAAIAAGYSEKCAQIQASKLLAKPHIAKAVGKIRNDDLVHLQLTREEILNQLYYCCTRDAMDFMDEKTGKIQTDVRKLTKRARNTIDGIKQTVKSWTDGDGNTHEEIVTELKLVGKASAIDMAMKHKGLFAAEKHELMIGLDFTKMADHLEPINVIESRIKAIEEQP